MSSTSPLWQLIKFVSILLALSVANQTVWGLTSLTNMEEVEVIIAFGNSTAEQIKEFEDTKDKNGKLIFNKKNEIPTLKMVLYGLPLTFELDIPMLNSLGLPIEFQTIDSSEEKKELAKAVLKKGGSVGALGVDLNYFYNLPPDNLEGSFIPPCAPFSLPCEEVTMPEDLMIATANVSICQPIKVAILGTGIDFEHTLFQPFKTDAYSVIGESLEDDNGHETHVSGIIAHTLYLGGAASNTQLISIKTLDKSGTGSLFSMLEGVALAIIKQAEIVNISSGYSSDDAPSGSFTPLLALAFEQAPNTLFVTSAGNDGTNNDISMFHYPSNINYLDNVFSVAALCPSDELAEYSNYGDKTVDLAAFGTGICSASVKAITGKAWTIKSGTSMATPQVTGTAALIACMGYNNPLEIKNIILSNVDYVPNLEKYTLANGRLNAQAALNGLTPKCSMKTSLEDSPQITKNDIHVYPNPITTNQKLSIELDLTDYQYVEIAIANHTGQFCPIYQGNYEAGNHTVNWSEMDCAAFSEAGIYFLQVIIGEEAFIHKIIRY